MKKLALILILVPACAKSKDSAPAEQPAAPAPARAPAKDTPQPFTMAQATDGLPATGKLMAEFVTDLGSIHCELKPDAAPETVASFVGLARGLKPFLDASSHDWVKKPFYDGLAFHRVIPGFVAQGGCPEGTGAGGPGWVIPCETKGNPHKHKTGALSMAHRGKDTGGSQFFLVLAPQPHLDGMHTVFGRATGGLDVMQNLEIGDEIKGIVFTAG